MPELNTLDPKPPFREEPGGLIIGPLGQTLVTVHVDNMKTEEAAMIMGIVLTSLNGTFEALEDPMEGLTTGPVEIS